MAKKKMSILDHIAVILLIIGGINWGLAIWNLNLVTMIAGSIPLVVKIVYGLVAASAIYKLITYVSKM